MRPTFRSCSEEGGHALNRNEILVLCAILLVVAVVMPRRAFRQDEMAPPVEDPQVRFALSDGDTEVCMRVRSSHEWIHHRFVTTVAIEIHLRNLLDGDDTGLPSDSSSNRNARRWRVDVVCESGVRIAEASRIERGVEEADQISFDDLEWKPGECLELLCLLEVDGSRVEWDGVRTAKIARFHLLDGAGAPVGREHGSVLRARITNDLERVEKTGDSELMNKFWAVLAAGGNP